MGNPQDTPLLHYYSQGAEGTHQYILLPSQLYELQSRLHCQQQSTYLFLVACLSGSPVLPPSSLLAEGSELWAHTSLDTDLLLAAPLLGLLLADSGDEAAHFTQDLPSSWLQSPTSSSLSSFPNLTLSSGIPTAKAEVLSIQANLWTPQILSKCAVLSYIIASSHKRLLKFKLVLLNKISLHFLRHTSHISRYQ